MKDRIRYSEAFKLKVMEELRDAKWKSVQEAARTSGLWGGSGGLACRGRRVKCAVGGGGDRVSARTVLFVADSLV